MPIAARQKKKGETGHFYPSRKVHKFGTTISEKEIIVTRWSPFKLPRIQSFNIFEE